MAINELAWMPNTHSKGELKANLEFSVKEMLFENFYQKMATPDLVESGSGFSIFYARGSSGDGFFLSTPDSPLPVGGLLTENRRKEVIVDTVVLMPRWQGKGYGFKLYQAALNKYGSLRSSTSLSTGAQKVWEVLCKKYKGKLAVPGEYFDDNKEVLVDIVGFADGEKGGRTPLVKDGDGNTRSLENLVKAKGKTPRSSNAARSTYYVIFK